MYRGQHIHMKAIYKKHNTRTRIEKNMAIWPTKAVNSLLSWALVHQVATSNNTNLEPKCNQNRNPIFNMMQAHDSEYVYSTEMLRTTVTEDQSGHKPLSQEYKKWYNIKVCSKQSLPTT